LEESIMSIFTYILAGTLAAAILFPACRAAEWLADRAADWLYGKDVDD
jgi:hypothetical protein